MAVINKAHKANVTCTMLIEGDTGDPIDIQAFINSIRIDKQYFDASFPVYSLDMKIPGDLLVKMQSSSILFNLKVVIRDVISDDELEERTLINEVLIPFDLPNDPMNFSDPNEVLEEEDTEVTTIPRYEYVIHLLSEIDYEKNKLLINEIYQNTRPKEALLNLIDSVINDSTKE